MRRLRAFTGSISTKIVLILVAFLLPINVLLIWLTVDSNRVLRRQAVLAAENILSVRMAELDKELEALDLYLLDVLNNDMDFTRFIQPPSNDFAVLAGNKLFYQFSKKVAYTPLQTGLFALCTQPKSLRVVFGPVLYDGNKAVRQFLLEEDLDTLLQHWRVVSIDGSPYLLRIFVRGDGMLGALLPMAPIQNAMAGSLGYQDYRLELGQGQTPFAPAEAGRLEVSVASARTGLVLRLQLGEAEVLQSLPLLGRLSFGLSLLFLLLIPALYLILHRILVKPLARVDRALRRVEDGDLDYRIQKAGGAAEFKRINSAFNNMVGEIQDLKIENYEQELQKQMHELRSLQLQIRPHFLFNLFSIIHNMASLQEYGSIKQMMHLMTEYFRYSIRTGYEIVPLEKELDFLDTYCRIAQVRYPDCFDLQVEVQPDARGLLLPPLLLHTFVENVFKHTVSMGSFVNIRVGIGRTGDIACIEIADDGKGMRADQLEGIYARIGKEDVEENEHIGIWNCKKRLEIIYGPAAQLAIHSVPAEGTRVTITFPFTKEAGYDTAADG